MNKWKENWTRSKIKALKKDHNVLGLSVSMLHLTPPPILSVCLGKVENAKDAQMVITLTCLQFRKIFCGSLSSMSSQTLCKATKGKMFCGPQETALTLLIVKRAGWIFKGVSSHFCSWQATWVLLFSRGTGKPFRNMWEETEERQRWNITIDERGKKGKGKERQTNSSYMFYPQTRSREWETGRESAGAAVEATLGLTEIIAVMDWLYSPEHGAPAPAITQQDDFADLRVRQLWKNSATICNW